MKLPSHERASTAPGLAHVCEVLGFRDLDFFARGSNSLLRLQGAAYASSGPQKLCIVFM